VGRADHSSRFGRCVIALVAAYALVISSFIANFSAAGVAAETAFNPAIVICHHDASGQLDPLSGHSNDCPCVDCGCCIGCLGPVAALPPPPALALPAQVAISRRLAPLVHVALGGVRIDKSHRSRAPPKSA